MACSREPTGHPGERTRTIRTGTATKIQLINGERYAVAHKQVLTGYKAPNSYGYSAPFTKGSTYSTGYSYDKLERYPNGASKKALKPYDWNSRRSRLPIKFPDLYRRNAQRHTQLEDPNPGHTDEHRFLTLHKHFYKSTKRPLPSHPGVLATLAQVEHQKIFR
eukprot:TRINITY_DN2380_c0_g1_i1.p1 TRINITY_DN2380_c0_g1~~TRINITY_DN2380_c0_g1_i1.p1  ORF type:complete len:163 (-),score=23.18 TRINITY_DN2380_c0_g1_i1:276-764(-)